MLKFAFNAQGLKVIMVVLHVWITKIYVATIEVHRKEKGGVEDKVNLVYHKNWWFFEFHPLLNVNVMLVVFLKIHPIYDQTQDFGVVFHTIETFITMNYSS